jgi:hypothetical protein
MWVMEVRSTMYGNAAVQAAPELWPEPSHAQWSLVRATTAVLMLHIALYTGWSWSVWQWNKAVCLKASVVVIGVFLLAFTMLNWKAMTFKRKPVTATPSE